MSTPSTLPTSSSRSASSAEKIKRERTIPTLHFHSREFIFSTSEKQHDWFSDVFIYDPENINERPLGSLLILGEVHHVEQRSTLHIINLIASCAKKEYYRLPKRGPKRSFEAMLHKVNTTLTDFTLQGHTDWIGHLDVLIIVFDGHHMRLTRCGKARTLLLRDGSVLDVTKELEAPASAGDPREQALKTFSDLVTGALAPDDMLLFGTSSLFHHVTLEHLRRLYIASLSSPATLARSIAERFAASASEDQYSFACTVSRVSSEPFSEPNEPPHPSSLENQDIISPTPTPTISPDSSDETLTVNGEHGYATGHVPAEHEEEVPDSFLGKVLFYLRRGLRSALSALSWFFGVLRTRAFPFISKMSSKGIATLRARKTPPSSLENVSDEGDVTSTSESEKETLRDSIVSEIQEDLPWYRSLLRLPLKWLRSGFSSFQRLLRHLPTTLKYTSLLTRGIAVIAVILIVVFAVSLVLRQQRVADEERNVLLDEKRLVIEQVLDELEVNIIYKERDKARELYGSAEVAMNEYREIEKNEEEIARYEGLLQEANDKLDLVVRVDRPDRVLADLDSALGGAVPRELLGDGQSLFTYTDDGRVFTVSAEGGDVKEIAKIEGVIQSASFLYRNALGSQLLFATDAGFYTVEASSGSVKEYNATLISEDVRDVVVYGNYVYYFLPESSQIIRHSRLATGLTEGLEWIKQSETINLEQVQSMAINGSVFVLSSNGSIVRYLSGYKKEVFSLELADDITNATSIATTLESDQLYVVEPSAGRVLLLNTSGELQAQYKGEAFSDVRDLWVDQESNGVYVLSGSKIFTLGERHE